MEVIHIICKDLDAPPNLQFYKNQQRYNLIKGFELEGKGH